MQNMLSACRDLKTPTACVLQACTENACIRISSQDGDCGTFKYRQAIQAVFNVLPDDRNTCIKAITSCGDGACQAAEKEASPASAPISEVVEKNVQE